MRGTALRSEAVRNLLSGTSRLAIWVVVTAAVCLLLGGFAAHRTASSLIAAQNYAAAGGTTYTLTSESHISGTRCQALASHVDVLAAGALREEPNGLSPATLPSTPIPFFSATVGFAELFPGADARTEPSGILVSTETANRLGVAAGAEVGLTAATGSAPAHIRGVYQFPEGATGQPLAYAALAEVPATDAFDSCWAKLRPSAASSGSPALALLRTTLLEPSDHEQVELAQVNGRMGDTSPDPRADPLWTGPALVSVALLAGTGIGIAAAHIRRLEIAAALHLGVARRDALQQHLLENATIATLGALIALPAVLWLAHDGVAPDNAYYSAAAGLKVLVSAVLGVLAGTTVRTATVKESDLYRYFRER
ncbi:hypothetical protein BJH93_06485 [Kocuria polaris]|nr:hypothetical protein [Kocuria polaris]